MYFNDHLTPITYLKAFPMILVQVNLCSRNPFHLLMTIVKVETLNQLALCKFVDGNPSSKCSH